MTGERSRRNDPANPPTRAVALIAMLIAASCAEQAPSAAPLPPPEPVTPVEVTGADEPEDELATLRARVSELEQQLAACRGTEETSSSGTEIAAAVPEGVDVPETIPSAQAARPDAGTRARRRREREPSLLDTILGPDERRRRDDDTIELPNPARVLLGE